MASLFQKHYNLTQVLQRFLSITLIASVIIHFISCSVQPTENKNITTIDSLYSALQAKQIAIESMDSMQVIAIEQQLHNLYNDAHFRDNQAALESIKSALSFLEILPKETAAIEKELDHSLSQLSFLKKDFQNEKLTAIQLSTFLADEIKAAETIDQRTDYITNNWNSYLLLIETLTKSINDE